MFYSLKNISKKEEGYVQFLENHLGNGNKVKIYQLNKTTRIVYSNNGINEHLSMSNHTRVVREVELQFAVEKIMKLKEGNIRMRKSDTGIIHLYYTHEKKLAPLK